MIHMACILHIYVVIDIYLDTHARIVAITYIYQVEQKYTIKYLPDFCVMKMDGSAVVAVYNKSSYVICLMDSYVCIYIHTYVHVLC